MSTARSPVQTSVRKSSRPSTLQRVKLPAISVTALVVFVAVWYGVTAGGLVSPLFLPSPVDVVSTGVRMVASGELQDNILASLRRVFFGFVFAAVVGIPLGIALSQSAVLKAALDPLLSLVRPLPSMSWIPLTLLWLGISETQKYTIVFMGTVAHMTLYMFAAASSVDPVLIKAARNLGASRIGVMRLVVLPGALPHVMSGLRVMLGIAWTCVISAELVAANSGLGFMIINAKQYFRTDQVILGMFVISLLVLGIDLCLNVAERKLLRWKE